MLSNMNLQESLVLHAVEEPLFRPFGHIISGDFGDLKLLTKNLLLGNKMTYVPNSKLLSMVGSLKPVRQTVYGGLPVEIGYCGGENSDLNALEYHATSEVNVAITDLVLLVGNRSLITDNCFDTRRLTAFKVTAGTAVELFNSTLHYAPLSKPDHHFLSVVMLPKETNYPLPRKDGDIIYAKGKWLLAHPQAQIVGACEGLQGPNWHMNSNGTIVS